MPALIDVTATMKFTALRKPVIEGLSLTLQRQLHLTLVTGSVVAGDRLKAMGCTPSDICAVDNTRHDAEHLFWECTAMKIRRRPFVAQIAKLCAYATARGANVSTYLLELLQSRCLRTAGIVPDDDAAVHFAETSSGLRYVRAIPVCSSMLIHRTPGAVLCRRGGIDYVLVFTDGSVKLPRSKWLSHAGWGLFVASDSSANDYGFLEDLSHTSYRAELRALVAALARAAHPVSIVIDNYEVCRRFGELIDIRNEDLNNGDPIGVDEDPLWREVWWHLSVAPCRLDRKSTV